MLAGALAAGCPVGPDLSVDPACELGTGEFEFERVTDGAELDVIAGIQGGFHIWGGVAATGLDWTEPLIEFEVRDFDSGDLLLEITPFQIGLGPDSRGWGELVAATLVIPRDDLPLVQGQDALFRVTLTDPQSRTCTDEADIRITNTIRRQGE